VTLQFSRSALLSEFDGVGSFFDDGVLLRREWRLLFSPFLTLFFEDERCLPLLPLLPPLFLVLLLVFLRSLWFEVPSMASSNFGVDDCFELLVRTLADVVDLYDSSIGSSDGNFFRPRTYGLDRECGLGAMSVCSEMSEDLEPDLRIPRECGIGAISSCSQISDDLEPFLRRPVRRCFWSSGSIDSLLIILAIEEGETGSLSGMLFILAISDFTMLSELLSELSSE